ncbi:DNA-binding response regulator, partial [Salmonella enterica]|nr:DNA-binding response regulator [Salmonella enterica]
FIRNDNLKIGIKMRLLFINDTSSSENMLLKELYKAGLKVDHFHDLLSGDRALALTPYCAVIIEMLPKDNNVIRMLSRWRRKGVKTPIMILAYERLAGRRVAVINSGADDCMEAPPDPEELISRINAIVRRRLDITSSQLHCGDIIFDTISRKIFLGEKQVRLTAREVALLEIFMMNSQRVLSKNFLIEKMYSWKEGTNSNVIEVFVSGLRRKLGKQFIRTISGQGYILNKHTEKE